MKIGKDISAQILIEALPYIQKFNNKIIVIKYGGNAMVDERLKMAVMGIWSCSTSWESKWCWSTGAARKSIR